MAKRVVKLNPKAVVQDIRDGMDDKALGAKYGLSPAQLPKLFQMLVERGFVHQSVLEARAASPDDKTLSDNADDSLGSAQETSGPDGHERIPVPGIPKDIPPESGSQIQEVNKSGPKPPEYDKHEQNSERQRVESARPAASPPRRSILKLAMVVGALVVAAVLGYVYFDYVLSLYDPGHETGQREHKTREQQVGSDVSPSETLSGEEDEDKEPPAERAYSNWHVEVDTHGAISTNLSLHAAKTLGNVSDKEVTAALQDSLQCALQNIKIRRHKGFLHLSADCRPPLQKTGFVVQGIIKPDPVRRCLEKLGPGRIRFSLSIPKLGYVQAPKAARERSHGPRATYSLDLSAQPSVAAEVPFEFGYRLSDLIWMLVPLALIVTVPILVVLRMRKRTLELADTDATAAWFGYWRVHRWIAEGVWLVWLVTVVCLRGETFVGFVFGIDHPALYVVLLFVPAGVVSFVCQYLSRPVWLRVRGTQWDRREMLLRGFLEHAVAILPIAFFIVGISSLSRDAGAPMLWFAAALVALLVGAWLHQKVTGTLPRTLLGGEFKERVLELAQQAGVKINQVLLMPAQQLQMGNAFAVTGSRVMITDYLLERLTKKETDSVMAHEIGHIKHHHTLLLSILGFLVIFMVVNWLLSFLLYMVPALVSLAVISDVEPPLALQDWLDTYLLFPTSLLTALLLRYFFSRKCERTADEFATLVTGDPESMITGLVKLSKMNLMPLRWGFWDESLGTHPSTMKRVKAIARRHRIPEERLSMLLETQPQRKDGEGYGIPDEVSNPELIFSTEFKSQRGLVLALLLFFTAATASLAVGYLISNAGLPSPVYVAGFVLVPVLYLLVLNYASLLGFGSLKCRMKAKLQKAGIDLEGQESHFVGIAPEEYPRVYDTQTIWDVGFLVVGEAALTYYGDRLSFSIPRDRITSITRGGSFPFWFSVPEIYVRWTDKDKDGVFHLHSVEGNSLISIGRSSKTLLVRLIDWHQGRAAGSRSMSRDSPSRLPELPDVKGLHPRQAVTAGTFLTGLMLIAFLVFGLGALFQLESFVSWYGLGTGAWCLFLGMLPPLRYKEER